MCCGRRGRVSGEFCDSGGGGVVQFHRGRRPARPHVVVVSTMLSVAAVWTPCGHGPAHLGRSHPAASPRGLRDRQPRPRQRLPTEYVRAHTHNLKFESKVNSALHLFGVS